MLGHGLVAVSPRHAAAGPPPRSPATRPRASSSGWRCPPAPDPARNRTPARPRLANRSRSAATVAAVLDEIADDPRFGHVEHHEVAAARVLHHLAGGRLGLLMVVLAVDDGGVAVARVALDPLPDVEHRAAGRVHQHAADLAQPLEVPDGDPEGRQDDDVIRRDRREIELAVLAPLQDADAHVGSFRLTCGLWMISPTR